MTAPPGAPGGGPTAAPAAPASSGRAPVVAPEPPGGAAVPPLGDEETYRTVGEALDAAAERYGDREAYVGPDGRIGFADWARAAEGVAGALAERGVGPGDVVALMLPSSVDYAVCYAAAARLGAVVTGLNTRLGEREVTGILTRVTPALVVRDEGLGLPPVPGGLPVLARAELAAARSHPGLGRRRPVVSPSDPAVIIWTSGTTGAPKGAVFDHRNLAAFVRSAGVMSRPFDRRLVATPFAHAGYMAKIVDQLAWGTTMVVSPVPWSAARMVDTLRAERITVAGAVPTQWAKLLELLGDDEGAARPDWAGTLRLGLAATAPAAPELVERVVARLGVPLVVRYAMTESPSVCGTEPFDPPEVQFRTVGRPQQGVEVALRDATGRDVRPGEVGRVWVRGECVMRGYWGDPELTAATLRPDGWLVSGDYGVLRPDGNLELRGRAGDLYIRGGYNVYPVEVENVLAEHPGVLRAAVVGVPAPVIGEIGVAYVVPVDPVRPPSLDDLRAWTRERLADYKAPDRVVVLDELPLTAMLKVDTAALRRRAAG